MDTLGELETFLRETRTAREEHEQQAMQYAQQEAVLQRLILRWLERQGSAASAETDNAGEPVDSEVQQWSGLLTPSEPERTDDNQPASADRDVDEGTDPITAPPSPDRPPVVPVVKKRRGPTSNSSILVRAMKTQNEPLSPKELWKLAAVGRNSSLTLTQVRDALKYLQRDNRAASEGRAQWYLIGSPADPHQRRDHQVDALQDQPATRGAGPSEGQDDDAIALISGGAMA